MSMDDAGVHSELSSLRSSISGLDHRLSDLVQRLSALDRHVGRVDDSVTSLAGNVVPAVKRIQSGLTALAEEFKRSRVIDAARDRRDDLDRELAQEFGRHEEVRNLAKTLIHVVHTGVVDERVLLETAQRRMVDLPDYWLAPAVVAIAAWLSHDKDKCDEALHLAMRLDRSKTALFMMLLLRHDNRGDALQRWIDIYLTGLQARNLPADFQVVIDGVAGGALGDGSAPKLADWMIDRYNVEAQSRDASTEAIEEWQQRLLSMGTVGDFAPTLASSCPDWAALRDRHGANLMIEAARRHFQGRFEAGADVPADLTDRMRDLVTKLARTYDGPEERLRRERWLEDFVAKTGDYEEAHRQLAAQEAGRTGSLNILSLVAASAYPASADGQKPAPTVTELLTIVLSKELIATAADMLHDSTSRPATVAVRVGRSPVRECTFNCGTDAEVTREALLAQAADLEAKVVDQVREEIDQQQGRVRRFARRPLPAAVVSSGVLAAVPFAVPTGAAAVDFVAPAVAVTAGAVAWLAFLVRRVRTVQNTSARELPGTSKALRDSAAELAELFEQERRSAQARTEFRRFLGDLTPGHAYRAVRPVDSTPYPWSRGFPGWTPLPPEERPGLGPPDATRPLR
jgi:hypothetical protein